MLPANGRLSWYRKYLKRRKKYGDILYFPGTFIILLQNVVHLRHQGCLCAQLTHPYILMPLPVVHKTIAPVVFFVCAIGDNA